jgi:hypothetical protein
MALISSNGLPLASCAYDVIYKYNGQSSTVGHIGGELVTCPPYSHDFPEMPDGRNFLYAITWVPATFARLTSCLITAIVKSLARLFGDRMDHFGKGDGLDLQIIFSLDDGFFPHRELGLPANFFYFVEILRLVYYSNRVGGSNLVSSTDISTPRRRSAPNRLPSAAHNNEQKMLDVP